MKRLSVIVAALVLSGAAADAQTERPAFRPRHFVVSGGLVVAGGTPVGEVTARIRRNSPGAMPPPFTLFQADAEILRAVGVEARVAWALTRDAAVEVGGLYSRPELSIAITSDPELSGGATISERLSTYVVDVSGIYQLSFVDLGRRMGPYVLAGGGYVRQLHEDRLLVETGGTFHAGAGLRYWFRGGGPAARAFGARAEVRVVRRTGGIDFEDAGRTYPSVSILAFAGF